MHAGTSYPQYPTYPSYPTRPTYPSYPQAQPGGVWPGKHLGTLYPKNFIDDTFRSMPRHVGVAAVVGNYQSYYDAARAANMFADYNRHSQFGVVESFNGWGAQHTVVQLNTRIRRNELDNYLDQPYDGARLLSVHNR